MPTAVQLCRTRQNVIAIISKFLPIVWVSIEQNRFAFMKLDDPSVRGMAYQKESLHGFKDVRDALETIQGHRCLLCGAPISDLHHIVPTSKDGMDSPQNQAGLCKACHCGAQGYRSGERTRTA